MTRRDDRQARLVRPGAPLDSAAALAGTVAHDLGNMLTVVLGNAELLAEALEDRPELAELVRLILGAAHAGTELTGRLDRFARRVPPAAAPADGAAILAALARRLAAGLPPGIRLETESAPDLPPVPVAASALALALQELASNALAALAGQGRLRLLADSHAEPGTAPRIRFTVEDDGPGMAPETLQRVRRMAFTSGIAGHKTGLGLALAARVALSGGGELLVDSVPGRGTRVTLDLPALPATLAEKPHSRS